MKTILTNAVCFFPSNIHNTYLSISASPESECVRENKPNIISCTMTSSAVTGLFYRAQYKLKELMEDRIFRPHFMGYGRLRPP